MLKRIQMLCLFSIPYLISINSYAHEPHVCPDWLPDSPVISGHIEHADIVNDNLKFEEVLKLGKELFAAQFNTCDGQGRPAATGAGDKRVADEPEFIRTSAPESNSCSGCHAQPVVGGSGDFVANVFVLAQALDPVTEMVSADFSNERNTLGMFGSGAIDMLAREMTDELKSQAGGLPDGEHVLFTKGVEFEVTISGGVVVASRGVDNDLIVKPFHQAGVVRSVREFTVNAFNHHHGMQAEERFDLNPDKNEADFDEDGVQRELTIGDITATTLFQAALPVPTQVLPNNPMERDTVNRGEVLFNDIGCSFCHVAELVLNSRDFVEPYGLNPAGTFNDTSQSVSFDMTKVSGLKKGSGNSAIVRAFTDLKRHNLCDDPGDADPERYYCNEQLAQGRPEQDGRPGQEFFTTRKLWDVGNSAPYGHRGDLTTIAEAIQAHGGEARQSRDSFISLEPDAQTAIVNFLKTLRQCDKFCFAAEIK